MAAFATPTASCWFICRRSAAPVNGAAALLTLLALFELFDPPPLLFGLIWQPAKYSASPPLQWTCVQLPSGHCAVHIVGMGTSCALAEIANAKTATQKNAI